MRKENFTILFPTKPTLRWFLSIGFVCFLLIQENFAQCPLACDDLVQVSVDNNCEAKITPDMILEDPGVGCIYTVVVFGPTGVPLPNATVTSAHIGKTLTVAVYLGNNSCWGSIYVEDKYPPEIRCPEPDTVFCNQKNYVLENPLVIDNCSDTTRHVISDVIIKFDCDSLPNIIGKRVITYYYTDRSGNHSDTCEQCVYFRKIDPLVDIVWPADTIFDCLDLDTVPFPSITGVPTVAGEAIYPEWSVCKIAVSYEDQILPVCPKTFKVLRKWTYIDWCRPNGQNVYFHYQVIKIVDERGPLVTCALNVTISTDVWKCSGTALLAPPTVIEECSRTTVKVGYKIASPTGSPTYEGTSSANVTKLSNGLYSITDLPLGLNWVIFQVTDECGNYTDCATEVFVEDKIPPIAVCDQKTVVTLTIDGSAKVEAATFDDRSHDNCGIRRYEAKRMDDGVPCDTAYNGDEWGPFVYFCCADIGKTLMVGFRVWDIHGNSNTCMVEIEVQDKLAPYIFCPPDITVSCEFDYADYSVFGTVRENPADRKTFVIKDKYLKHSAPLIDGYAYDGCGVDVIETVTTDLKCGQGYIYRKFEAKDPGGLVSTCTQRIRIVDSTANNVSVQWPIDYFSNSNCLSKPQLSPDITGKPWVYGADKCSNVVTTYDDLVFTLDPDACLKILRKWVVIDWCVWNPNQQNSPGYWTWTQVIKITNTVPPRFLTSCNNRTIDVFGPGCGGNIDLIASADDDCTDSSDLVWHHHIDLYNDNIVDSSYVGSGKSISAYFPIGVHKVTFTVWDACNNKSTCSYLLTVRDGKKPTPYCIGHIVTTVMPSTLSVEIWAKDFNINSEDNCTPKDSLKYYFLINGRFEPSMLFTCSNIGVNIVRVYVVDQAGNSEYCEVQLDVQDPNKVCPTGLTIQGKVTTITNSPVEGVSAIWERPSPAGTNTTYTDKNGVFAFNYITPGMNYNIRAEKTNGNYVNGVSTYDIVLIQKHILGIQTFDSPYKFLAADVNASCSITAADISEIRRLILGITNKFEKSPSWKFVPVNATVPSPMDPCAFKSVINYNLINRNQLTADFFGMKMGDINIDVDASNAQQTTVRNVNKRLLVIDDMALEAGKEYRIPVYFETATHLEGMQLSMQFDDKRVKVLGLEPGKIQISDEEFNVQSNEIRIALGQQISYQLSANDIIWYLVVKPIVPVQNAKWISLSQVLKPECYNENLEIMTVDLKVRGELESEKIQTSVFYQNQPNPFKESTKIAFELTNDQEVEFIAYELDGKVIYRSKKAYTKGYHELELKSQELNTYGVFFLQMNTIDFTDTKRLILIR
ncbi:MAG: hypothetical protein IPM92_11515 [Saprospiraceae bacterium]|nr:hypothetical protein [Saprospiraceae bacterium]